MKSQTSSTLSALRRIQAFLDANDVLFAPINKSSARRNLDDAVTDLSAHALDQEGGKRGSKGETALQKSLRFALRVHHMRPIATAARLKLRDVPEFAALTMPRTNVRMERFITAAYAMSEAAKKHEPVLIEAGLDVEFIAHFDAATQTLAKSIGDRGEIRRRRAGATAGLKREAVKARGLIAILDARVLKSIGTDNAKLRGQWVNAKRVDGTPGPAPSSTGAGSQAGPPSAGTEGGAPKAA